MHDLGYFREHLNEFEQMAANRGVSIDFDGFRALDRERRERITSAERLKAERNKASEEIARRKKAGEDASALLTEMKRVSDEIKLADERIAVLDARLTDFMLTVPNRPHSSVPAGHEAAANVEVRRWGAPPKFDFTPRPHWEIAEGAGILDFQRATKIASTRFALYRGLGARMERMLASFFLDTHVAHGYMEILPPFIVNTAALTGVGQLPKFAADMFHLEGTDLWLTPTAEVELTGLYRQKRSMPRRCRSSSAPGRRASLRGRRCRQGHSRAQAPAPIPESRIVQVHAARQSYEGLESLVTTPSASCKSSAFVTASCSCARATWGSHRQRL